MDPTDPNTVWVTLGRDVKSIDVSLAGAGRVLRDARYGVQAFRMRTPLAPGAGTELTYHVEVAQRGIRSDGFDLSVVENGSFVTHRDAFPALGYRPRREIRDEAERRRRGGRRRSASVISADSPSSSDGT